MLILRFKKIRDFVNTEPVIFIAAKLKSFSTMCIFMEFLYLSLFTTFALSNSPNGLDLKKELLPSGLLLTNKSALFISYTVLIAGLFSLYFLSFLFCRVSQLDQDRLLKYIFVAALTFNLTLLFLPPFMSTDVFSGAIRGRTVVFYHQNPYTAPPASFPSDPVLKYIDPGNREGISKGPAWVALEALVALIFGGGIALHIFALKSVAVLFYLSNVFLIHKILDRMAPKYSVLGTVFYAFNPLIIVESAGMGHNDVAMMFFVLLCVFLHQRNRYLSAAVALAVSVSIKYTMIVLLPAYLVLLVSQRKDDSLWHKALTCGKVLLVFGGVIAVFFLPLGPGSVNQIMKLGLSQYTPGTIPWLSNKLGTQLMVTLWHLDPESASATSATGSKVILGLIWLVYYLVKLRQVRDINGFANFSAAVLLLLTVLVLPVWRQWYFIWFLSMAAITAREEWYDFGILLSAGSMLLYLFRPKCGVYVL